MKTNHLQSMLALNANRITRMHNQHAQYLDDARQFKNTVAAPTYQQYVDMARAKAYSVASGITKDIARAVELQKALQEELRINNAAAKAAKEDKPKKEVAKSLFYTRTDGFCDDTFCVEEFPNGKRICHRVNGTSSSLIAGSSTVFGDCVKKGDTTIVQHTTRQYPVDVQAPRVYSIDEDGQPKKDGVYEVMYINDTNAFTTFEFKNGKWYHLGTDYTEGQTTGFGNCTTEGERYIVK